jgi:Flp pilus assembly protein TadD
MKNQRLFQGKKVNVVLNDLTGAARMDIYPYLILLVILILTTLVYSASLHYSILSFDDVDYFFNYQDILHLSWKSFRFYFSNYYLLMYQPLPVLSFAINYATTGLNTLPMHLVNLGFHLLNIILVYQLFRKLTRNSNISLVISLIFAIHPMNVEAVTWISARSTAMYSFFYLLSLICYLWYLESDNKKRYLVMTLGCFLLSLLCKVQAMSLPVVLILLDYFSQRKPTSNNKILVEKIPFFLLSILFGFIAISNTETAANMFNGKLINYSVVDIFFLSCYSIIVYVFKFLIPAGLCAIYTFPQKTGDHLPLIIYFSPLILMLIAWFIRKLRKNIYFMFGIGFFLVTIFVNLPVFSVRQVIIAERYSYFPFLGLVLIICILLKEEGISIPYFSGNFKLVLYLLFVVYIGSFFIITAERTKVWKDDYSLMSDIVEKNPPTHYISKFYRKRADFLYKQKKFEEAVRDYSHAVALNGTDDLSYIYRAYSYLKLEKFRNAKCDFDSAIKLDPYQAIWYANRAFAEYNLNDADAAVRDCNLCLALDSTVPDAYHIRALVYFAENDFFACKQDLDLAILYRPDYAEALMNRGRLYIRLNETAKAYNDIKQAARLGNPQAIMLYRSFLRTRSL